MDEKLTKVVFEIISHSGKAKFYAKEAIKESKKKEFEQAEYFIKEADKAIQLAHSYQTELITKEVDGEKVEVTVLLIHSQDHLMSSMDYIEVAREFIEIYKSI